MMDRDRSWRPAISASSLLVAVCWPGGLTRVAMADGQKENAATGCRGEVSLVCWNPSFADTTPGGDAKSTLGIGFLWTAQSEMVVGKLKSENDFVDVIIGPGKLDIFEKAKPPLRVACIARSLEKTSTRPFPGVKETVEILRGAGVQAGRVIIAYNPEGQPGTPSQELNDLVGSCRKAREMAQAYGAPLLVGPGLRYMEQREHLYPDLAGNCDYWMVQSQRWQLDESSRKPVDAGVYRGKVRRIADQLRRGNPNIRIYVQLVTTAERGTVALSAKQIALFARAIEDRVDAVRIHGAPAELLIEIIERMRGGGAGASRTTPSSPPAAKSSTG